MAPKKAENKPTKQPGWLNKKEMVASIGISATAFDKWGVQPISKVGRECFFTVDSVLQNRQEKQAAEEEQYTNPEALVSPEQLDYQRFRKLKEEADKLELANTVTRREQAPVSLLEWALASLTEQASSVLDAIPGKIKKRVPHLKANEMAVIEYEVTKCRNAGAKTKLPWDQLEVGD